MYKNYIKRIMDFLVALFSVIFLSPVYLVVAVLVRFKLGSPIIFCQNRPGKNEEVFKMYKFRTMTNEKDIHGNLLPDMIRLTKFGRFLRNSSLDELPELFNILKGDMSIVGPRPLLIKYLPFYNDRQRHRHDVRPGLTGLAQVKGRNTSSWEERFEQDVLYVQDITLLGDLIIILQTIKSVVKKEGIDSNENIKYTMPEFTGSVGDN
ncbi:MAG: sugar transferase [Clostridia bacterium]